jgi:hypothetical protein
MQRTATLSPDQPADLPVVSEWIHDAPGTPSIVLRDLEVGRSSDSLLDRIG